MLRLHSNAVLPTIRLQVALLLAVASVSTTQADVFTNVPEATIDGYQLVYELAIANDASYNITGSVPYSVDNSASFTAPFDRVAYYLELDNGSGLEYAYASMDAFTSNISQVGLPIDATGANFQQTVSGLNVFSNSGNVTTGTGITTGNIEFWPRNYHVNNSNGVPGANNGTFDFGDGQFGNGNFGSFQVHNYGAGETIFAYNQWGGEPGHSVSDLGIGSRPVGDPDWTFAANANTYTVKNLQVLVRPGGLSVDSSLGRAIFQRNSQNEANVPITGSVENGITSIEARATPRAGSPGTTTGWQVIDASPSGNAYAGALDLDGGWYDIEVRSLNGASVVDQRTVERVGVGEVFVIAGQSNSANDGSPALAAAEDRVSSFDLNNWRHADDPQPIATGSGGSPWPALGDQLVGHLDVPVGFISVGWGGTRVDQWVPGANGPDSQPLYNRLKDALQALGPNGARAVLWHQGEADNEANSSNANYVNRLETIIAQSRIDAGYDIPWGVAQASFLPYLNPTTDPAIIQAQAQVAANDPLNFVGASTDDLINGGGTNWRWDGIHFNQAGLIEHADRWFNQLNATFGDYVVPEPSSLGLGLLGASFGLSLSRNRRSPSRIRSGATR